MLLGLAEALKHAGRNAARSITRGARWPGPTCRTRPGPGCTRSPPTRCSRRDDMPAADRAGAEADAWAGRSGSTARPSSAPPPAASWPAPRAGSTTPWRYARQRSSISPTGRAATRPTAIPASGWARARGPGPARRGRRGYTRGRREAESLGTGWSLSAVALLPRVLLAARGRLDDGRRRGRRRAALAQQLTAQPVEPSPCWRCSPARRAARPDATGPAALRGMQSLWTTASPPPGRTWPGRWRCTATPTARPGRPAHARRVYDGLPVRVLLLCNDPAPHRRWCASRSRPATGPARRPRPTPPAAGRPQPLRRIAGRRGLPRARGCSSEDLDALHEAVHHLRRSPRPLDRAHATGGLRASPSTRRRPGARGEPAGRGDRGGDGVLRRPGGDHGGAAPANARNAPADRPARPRPGPVTLAGLTGPRCGSPGWWPRATPTGRSPSGCSSRRTRSTATCARIFSALGHPQPGRADPDHARARRAIRETT